MQPTSEVTLPQTQAWLSVPTAKADKKKRDVSDGSVCGWLGGRPDLPALCAGASSCVRDTEHKYVGCCGVVGSCTAGIYTSCVDQNSPGWSPPPSIQTNGVYTCAQDEECYRNTFPEDYYQFGCGKSSWATRVETTFTGQPPDVTLHLVYTAVTFPGTTTMPSESPTAVTSDLLSMSIPASSIPTPSSTLQQSDVQDPGAVAGIVIGVVNVIVIFAGLVLCLCLRRRRKRLQRTGEYPSSPTRDLTARNSNPMQRLSEISHIPKILPTPLRISSSLASYRSPHISKPILQASPTSSRYSSQRIPLVSSNIERDDFNRLMSSIHESNAENATLRRRSNSQPQFDVAAPSSSKDAKKSPILQSSPMHDDDIDDDNTLEYYSVSGNFTNSPHSRESQLENDITSSVSLMSDQDESLATASVRQMTHVRRGPNGGYHLVNQIVNDGTSDPISRSNITE